MADAATTTPHAGSNNEEPYTQDPVGSAHGDEKTLETVQIEDATHDQEGNLIYGELDVEPEIHWRTWMAFLAIWLVNFTFSQTTAGPPTVVSPRDFTFGAIVPITG